MIYGGRRGCGKTTELIKLASKDFLYIVCADRNRAHNIARMANDMELDIPYPIAADELPLRGVRLDRVLVDDAEDVLQALIRIRVVAMSTSMEMKELKGER